MADAVFASDELKVRWETAISARAVEYFTGLVTCEKPQALKSYADHAKDARIPSTYVKRAFEFLEKVGLIEATKLGEQIAVGFTVPVTREPPSWAKRPPWAAGPKKP